MPLSSSETTLSARTSVLSEDGPTLECSSDGERLRIRARRAYGIPCDSLFAAWTRRDALDLWLRLRSRSRVLLAPHLGGSFRLELAEGPTIHVITGSVLDYHASEYLSLSWVHDEKSDCKSIVQVWFRERDRLAEIVLVHREIENRREAAWLMKLWSNALTRLGSYLAEGAPLARSAQRLRVVVLRNIISHMTRRRAPQGIPVLIPLDPKSNDALSRQIYRALRDGILAGRLAPGFRLPSTRALASDLGVSRNTVVTAFDQLLAEGYVESRVGRGTRVSQTMPDHLLHARARPRVRPLPSAPANAPSARGALLVERAARKSSMPETAGAVAFAPGVPALDLFPWQTWGRLVAKRGREIDAASAGYGDTLGYRPLREAVARYVAVARGVVCNADQIIIVGGSQQGLDLVARVVTDPGDSAWIEDPGYQGALGAFVGAGLNITGVPVDADGMSVVAGRVGAPAARIMYVTPSHQFPLGVTMSLSRRLELLSAAGEMQAWIIEDDYDSEFRYVSRPLTALQGLDTDARVVYVGTFSKVMFPALRIGFIVAPPSLVPTLAAARQFAGTQQATLEQMVLTEFIVEGHFERHVRRMRNVYAERQHDLIEALNAECSDLIDVAAAGAGMHLVGWLRPDVDDRDVSARAASRGVDAIPLSAFAVSRGVGRAGVLLGYAHVDRRAMLTAAKSLAAAIRESVAQFKRSELLISGSRGQSS